MTHPKRYAYNGRMKHPTFDGTNKKRVSVFLEREDLAMVKRVAERAGTGQSDVIRRSLREGCLIVEAELDRYDRAGGELRDAIEHENLGEMAPNPGGIAITGALDELGLSVSDLDQMDPDERTLTNHQIWCRAWALREADEA